MSGIQPSNPLSDFSAGARSGAPAGDKGVEPASPLKDSPASARNYYVCSYGGSGSWTLVKFLRDFGNAFHLHTRHPPKRLTKPVDEHFGGVAVCPGERHFVVFLYSRPSFSITRSASFGPAHWHNIGVPWERFPDIPRDPARYLQLESDPVDYLDFFNNYISGEVSYPVLAVNYHRLWEHLPQLFDALEIPRRWIPAFPRKRECRIDLLHNRSRIFAEIDGAIDRMPPIRLIEPRGESR